MECGGPRVRELNPPHSAWSGGVNRLPPRIMAKTFLSRNLAFLLAARWPPTLAPDGRDRLLFCLLFFDRFLEGILFLLIFGLPWGPRKSSKIAKSLCRQVFFFRPYAFHALLADFDSFWVVSGGEKVGFFMAGAMKYAFSPKMSFCSPGIDFELILAAFWVPGEA